MTAHLQVSRTLAWRVLGTFVVMVLASGSSISAAAPSTQPVEPTVVFAAVRLIRVNHVDSHDSVRLLPAALNGLSEAVSRAGVSERLADLETGSEDSTRASFATRFNQALALVQGKLSVAQLEHAAINAMASNLNDGYTRFITPEELAQSRRGGFGGIGVQFRVLEGRWYIWRVFDGPAAEAGIREFDQLIAVDGESVRGWTDRDIRGRVRGPEGSTIRLTLRRPGQAAPLTVVITRGFIVSAPLQYRMRGTGIGYISLNSFLPGTGDRFHAALTDLARQPMRALILDVRYNSGGRFSELDQVARLLLPSGLVIYSMAGKETGTGRTTGTPTLSPAVRLVVLVDSQTEGPAELLAGAISDHARGRLVGVRTPGLGAIGRTFDLPDSSAIQIKTGTVSTGRGVPLERNGIRPDVEVALSADDLDRGRDPQLERAMEIASQ